MGELVEYRSPQRRDETTAWIGMLIFLASWTIMFVGLFIAYFGLRTRSAVWPPIGLPTLSLVAPTFGTFAIGLSSGAVQFGIWSIRAGQPRRLALSLTAATILGTAFMAVQIASWLTLETQGLSPASSTYGSVFYGLTGIHAAHVAVGLVALLVLAIRAFGGRYTPARFVTVRLWGLYWHFVGAIWLLIFVTVYIL